MVHRLTIEDLSEALVCWVVDVYHRRPHGGLGGETPANCWNRLVSRYGVAPMPSVELRRKALGTRWEKTVTKKGITVLGIRYHSEVLARWFMHATSKKVRIRFYSEDIGAIAVELDDQWIEVPSVFERYRGERAQTWILAAQEIRASVAAQKKIDEEVIFKAMTRIREINANALSSQRLLVDDYSKERLAELEDELLIGLEVDDTPHNMQILPATDGLGLELTTSQPRTTQVAKAPDTAFDGAVERGQLRASDGASTPPSADDNDTWSFGEK